MYSISPPSNPQPLMFNLNGAGQPVIYQNGTWYEINLAAPHGFDEMYQWYQNKKAEELKIADLCAKNPGLQDAKTAYEVMLRLAENG